VGRRDRGAKDGARVLWKYSRNPLVAQPRPRRGVGARDPDPQEPRRADADPGARGLGEAARVGEAALRPIGSHYVLDVCGLYWRTHRVLHAILA
jgi:hypothetical protein